MQPVTRKLTDAAIVMAASAIIAFIIIAAANSLVAKASLWKSYAAWLAFVTRSDIVATTLLAVIVTMAVSSIQISRGKR